MTDEKEKAKAFEQWCYTAQNPETNLPLLTHIIYKVCQENQERFKEAVEILKKAFKDGYEEGYQKAADEAAEDAAGPSL